MWKRIRAKLGADWPLILATLLVANLVFVLLLQMQRTAIYGQQIAMTNSVNDALRHLNSAEEERQVRASLLQNDIIANFKQIQLGTNQIPVFAGKQQAALETIQATLNDVITNLNQVQLGTNQIPALAEKQQTTLFTIQRTLNDAMANLDQIQLGTNQIPTLADKQQTTLLTIQKTLNDAMANLNQIQLGTNQIPALADKQQTTLLTVQRTLNDAMANLNQVQLGTNQIPLIVSMNNSGLLERIEMSLKQMTLLLTRVEKLMAPLPKVERP